MERDQEIVEALLRVVEEHPRWGFWKCYDRLRLLGHRWNHKRVYRVYCELRLNVPRRVKRKVPQRLRRPLAAPAVLRARKVAPVDFRCTVTIYHPMHPRSPCGV